MIGLLGPLSSARPDGGGPFANWLGIIIATFVLTTGWRKFLSRDIDPRVSLSGLVGLTIICAIIIGTSIWGLFH
jgi:glycopeptide antibiotics resistance protein